MKTRCRTTFVVLLLLLLSSGAMAQDIEIRDFKTDPTNLKAANDNVKDLAGNDCALIRFSTRDTTFTIETNVGIVKRVTGPGEILVYVPTMAQRLTVKHDGLLPLRRYKIPMKLEPKRTYDATIWAVQIAGKPESEVVNVKKDTIKTPVASKETAMPVTPARQDMVKEQPKKEANVTETHMRMYAGAGFEVVAMTGVSMLVGMEAGHHVAELGATIGVGKSETLYFYDSKDNLVAGRKYGAMRMSLRYGYELQLTKTLALTPMIGGALNVFSGNEENGNPVYPDYYKEASSVSLIPAVRLSYAIGKSVRLHATPGFALGVYKSNNCKLIAENDSKFKSWTDGFSLNVGVNILF